MTWAKLCDSFWHNTKVMACEPATIGFFACCLSYCGKELNNGRILKGEIDKIMVTSRGRKINRTRACAQLLDAGLMEDDGDAYLICRWLNYNRSFNSVQTQRQHTANRVAAYEKRKRDKAVQLGHLSNMAEGTNAVSNNVPDPVPDPKHQIQNLEPTDDKQELPEVLSAEVVRTAVVGEAVSAHEPEQDASTGPPGIQPDAQQRALDAHESVQRVDPTPAHGLVPINRLDVPQNVNHEMAAGSSVHSTSTHTLHDPLNVPQPAHEDGDDVPLTAEQALSVACTADPHNFGLPTNVIPSHAKAFRPMAGIVTRWDIKLALWRCRLKTAGDCLPGVRSRLYTIGLLLHYLKPPMARRLHGPRADQSQRMAREVGNLVKHQEDRRALAEEGAYNKQPTVYGWMRSSN